MSQENVEIVQRALDLLARRDWPGIADADLIGAAIRVTFGKDTLERGTVELRERRGGRTHVVARESAVEAISRLRHTLLHGGADMRATGD